MLIVAAILVAVALCVAVVLIGTIGVGTTGVARSLELVNYRPDSSTVAKSELAAKDRLVVPFEQGLKGVARRLSPAGTAGRLAASLNRAGNPPAWPVERIFGAKGIGLVAGALLGLFFGGLGLTGLLYAVIGGAALFFLPDLLVYNAGIRRQEQLRKGFADALDMLTVCVESGQGFDAALGQVARNVTGPIAGEFARVLSEFQIGMTRGQAFQGMAERNTSPEVKNFVSALVQADRLGVPIAGVLREQTKEMRVVRRQLAEEKAQKVTVKVVFPVLLCIFPVIFVVILGPAAINIYDLFSKT
ncbi:probable secretion system protein TadC [Janibacter sp. HTCC2649]|uniref:type II secretion system F family protein n=1 Tax=Janibacter sp. HTCC2649 TaxID=313589 RepID=UPI0000670F27|nr:type II secretion system F family protein [Janibacter sp. HTCC2649]EAP97564.1 probable secretion system protein TadC [Janibacter sp. HTCC2649]